MTDFIVVAHHNNGKIGWRRFASGSAWSFLPPVP
jgi:hypothetical protein